MTADMTMGYPLDTDPWDMTPYVPGPPAYPTMPIPNGNQTQPVRYDMGAPQGLYVSQYADDSRPTKVYRSDHATKPSNRALLGACVLMLTALVVVGAWVFWYIFR